MRTVVQRVTSSSVIVNNKEVGKIKRGLTVLVGFTEKDTLEIVDKMIQKLLHLRIFEDEKGIMNKSIQDIKGEILLISQFTLYGDVKNGNRPSYQRALSKEKAQPLYEEMIKRMKKNISVETGIFGADMQVEISNDGPVTILIEL